MGVKIDAIIIVQLRRLTVALNTYNDNEVRLDLLELMEK